jgi:hypothetical protein
MSVINGTDLYMWMNDILLAYSSSYTITIEAEARERTNKGTGVMRTYTPGLLDVSVSCDGLYVYAESADMLYDAIIARVPVKLDFGEKQAGTNILDNTIQFDTGNFIITSLEKSAGDAENATYSASFKHSSDFGRGVTTEAEFYWVSTTGTDGAGVDGSSDTPWHTLAYACTRATTAGDIIHIEAGTFTETIQSVVLPGVSIIGSGDTTIITTAAALNPIISLASLAQGTAGNQSISYIRIDGDIAGLVGIGVYARSSVSIHHCSFIDTANYGVYFTGLVSGNGEPATYATGNSVHHCTFTNCAKDTLGGGVYTATGALAIGGQSGMLVYNNAIDESYGRHGYGIKYCGDGYNRGLKIYNNTIEIDVGRGVANSWAMAIELWSQRGGIEIYGNTLTSGSIDIAGYDTTDAGGYGFAVTIHDNTISWGSLVAYDEKAIYLELSVSGGVYIYNNYIHNVPTVLAMYPYDTDTIEDVYFYYNICNEIRQSGAGYTGRITMINSVTGDVVYDNLQFHNNTIYNSTQTIGSAFHFSTDNATITNIVVNSNIINNAYNPIRFEDSDVDIVSFQHNNCHDCHHNNITYNASTGTTVTEASNSLVTDDPTFVTAGSDFHLQAGSPCINAGVATGLAFITTDYDDQALSDPPEIGAYEY